MQINENFKQYLPKLKDNEYNQLEKNIINDGCRDPLVLWNDTLIDGHNRYKICNEHDILYNTIQMDFDNEIDVKIWMVDNQHGQRNLTEWQEYQLANIKRELLKEKGRARQAKGGKEYGRGIPQKVESRTDSSYPVKKSREVIAESLGWSNTKLARADVIEKKATPEVKEQLLEGNISINKAYTEIKKAEKIKSRETKIAEIKEKIETENIKTPDGLFDVIAIDPPWDYGRKYDPETSRVANPYPEMSQEELKQIEIPAKDNSVMFLWTTHKFLFNAKELLDVWGFDYKACLVWNKEKMGMGAWFRMQCEFCLVGVKGRPFFDNTKWRDIMTESRREHSRKPDVFFDMVNDITTGRKLDYFAREEREAWETFGVEV